jgi:hypothetical protein
VLTIVVFCNMAAAPARHGSTVCQYGSCPRPTRQYSVLIWQQPPPATAVQCANMAAAPARHGSTVCQYVSSPRPPRQYSVPIWQLPPPTTAVQCANMAAAPARHGSTVCQSAQLQTTYCVSELLPCVVCRFSAEVFFADSPSVIHVGLCIPHSVMTSPHIV